MTRSAALGETLRTQAARTIPDRHCRTIVFALLMMLCAACAARAQAPGDAESPAGDLEAAQARAVQLKQPLMLFITESGGSKMDERARSVIESRVVKAVAGGVVRFTLDLAVSRNRATAARFHAVATPLVLFLSPHGIIISRDDTKITRHLVMSRIDEATLAALDLDAKLATLQEVANKDTNNIPAQFHLTDFLLAHGNDFEAIPRLTAIAHSESYATPDRVRAWVALARAHLWVAEPEKGRHEAKDLISTLGPGAPEARAGGNLVLGLQDANAKRTALAKRELEDAVAAAPDSPYGKEASAALGKLGHVQATK